MDVKQIVTEAINPILDKLGAFLVDITVSDSKIRKKIVIFVDTELGIQIDECSNISRELGEVIEDQISTAFTLEVSSPGADAPLRFEKQYSKHIGRTLKVTTTKEESLEGELIEKTDNKIIIQPKKKKKETFEPIEIPFEEIKEAKVVISFK